MKLRILMLLLFCISIFFRLWLFWQPTFSGDESLNVERAETIVKNFQNLFSGTKLTPKELFLPLLLHNHPPAEILLLIPSLIFQPREVSVRLTNIIISVTSLIISYLLLKKWRSPLVATIFLVILGTSVYVIWWDQTAIYISTAIVAGVGITLATVNFFTHPSRRSLIWLSGILALSLLVFQGFLLLLPIVIWLIWGKKARLTTKDLVLACLLFLFISGIFYAPYILYALDGEAPNAGFNYIFSRKLTSAFFLADNLRLLWQGLSGFSPLLFVLPISLMALFVKNIPYAKYLLGYIGLYTLIFIVKIANAEPYLFGVFGSMSLLAADVLSSRKKLLIVFIIGLSTLNAIGLTKLIQGRHNPFFFEAKDWSRDGIKSSGELAKRCLSSKLETYLSTDNSWRTGYYFGRHSLLETDGLPNRAKLIQLFVNDKITLDGNPNFIKLVHIKTNHLSSQLETAVRQKAISEKRFGDDLVFLFKDCP